MQPRQSSEPRPIRIGDPPPHVPPLQIPTFAEIFGGHVCPIDLVPLLSGERGNTGLRIGGAQL
jgi:hypothetical protein